MTWTEEVKIDDWTRLVRGYRVCAWCLHNLGGLTPRQLSDHWSGHVSANAAHEALRA